MSLGIRTPPAVIGVGIDTHGYSHQVTFLDSDRQHAAPDLSVAESAEGYARLQQACFDPDCGIHGNVLDFWTAWRRLPLREAALDLADTFHLQLVSSDE